jgi:hypothetical protein
MSITPTRTHPENRALIGTGLIAVVIGRAAFVAVHGGTAAATAPTPPAATVSVATVVKAPVAAWEVFSGRLEAVDRVDLLSRHDRRPVLDTGVPCRDASEGGTYSNWDREDQIRLIDW